MITATRISGTCIPNCADCREPRQAAITLIIGTERVHLCQPCAEAAQSSLTLAGAYPRLDPCMSCEQCEHVRHGNRGRLYCNRGHGIRFEIDHTAADPDESGGHYRKDAFPYCPDHTNSPDER